MLTLETYVYSRCYHNADAELADYRRTMTLLKMNQQIGSTATTSILPFVDFDMTGPADPGAAACEFGGSAQRGPLFRNCGVFSCHVDSVERNSGFHGS